MTFQEPASAGFLFDGPRKPNSHAGSSIGINNRIDIKLYTDRQVIDFACDFGIRSLAIRETPPPNGVGVWRRHCWQFKRPSLRKPSIHAGYRMCKKYLTCNEKRTGTRT